VTADGEVRSGTSGPKIAVFSGPTATVLNSPPLITRQGDGSGDTSDTLRAQRLAHPAVVYVEPMTAHPLERDSADLYGPPDCLLDDQGNEHPAADPPTDGRRLRPVHRIVLRPDDGLFLLPYVATTVSGAPWQGSGVIEGGPEREHRQTFYPDAERLYEEIDRFGVDDRGRGRILSREARFEFFRPLPSGGYRGGLPAASRTDRAVGGGRPAGDIGPETLGLHYFPYSPRHLRADPPPAALARATNFVQGVLGSGEYAGGQWLEGSPAAEETLYWFSLLLDIRVPLVGHVAQRPHGTLSADGGRNVVDGVHYILGRAWEGDTGSDEVGAVLVADQVVYAAREVAKTDARPGNYVAAGGFGGIVGRVDTSGRSVVTYRPTYRFTHRSELNLSRLPAVVRGRDTLGTERVVEVLNASGELRDDSLRVVAVVTYGRYAEPCCGPQHVGSWLEHCAAAHPLAGIVGEGANPYGHHDASTDRALRHAALSGVPVVKCGRGGTRGFTPRQDAWAISANNLTASKARILLMAALLKFGALPAAADPSNPGPDEEATTAQAVRRYQEIFDSH
jgi:L-asparaginase